MFDGITKFARMAAQNEDLSNGTIPYCLINTDKCHLADAALSKHLQPIASGDRGAKLDSIKEFMARIDPEKLSWKTVAREQQPALMGKYCPIFLTTATHSAMINTGIEDLLVGSVIFAMPAIPYLAKNNPSVRIFNHQGQQYVHPVLLSAQDHTRLTEDVLMLANGVDATKPSTVVGSMLKSVMTEHGEGSVDLDKLIYYLAVMRPVGKVIFSMDDNRQSVYNIATTKVSVGGEFICLNNLFV